MTDRENPLKQGDIVVSIDADLQDLIPGYLAHRRTDVERIRRALEERDYAALRTMGHQMKGTGGGYGFDAITDIGRAIEEAARAGQDEEIRRQGSLLLDYLDRVRVVFV